MSHTEATRLSQKGSTVIQDRDDRAPAPDSGRRSGRRRRTCSPARTCSPSRTCRARADARARCRASAAEPAFDPAAIMASIGEIPYEWSIDSDVLTWGANAADVLMVGEPRRDLDRPRLRQAARRRRRDKPLRRGDEIGAARRRRRACPIRCNMRCIPAGADKGLWIEDTGRWFAGADGKPARAHGVVRVINERHEQEERLTYLSRFDALTGEMNRWHLTEVLETTLQAGDRAAQLLRLPAGRDRQSRAHQRSLRLRRRRRGDRRGGQAPARQDARRRSARPLLRQQVRRHPEELHARRHGQRRPSACSPACATTWCAPAPARSRSP